MRKQANVQPQYLGVDDAETYSGISKWTWRRKAYAGEIASTKVGKRLLIPKSEIDRVMTSGYRAAVKKESV